MLCWVFAAPGALGPSPSYPLPSRVPHVLRVLPPRMQQPWDGGRALRTALFFNSPFDAVRRVLMGGVAGEIRVDGVLWDGSNPSLEWGPLDDVVMGGVSQSSFTVAGGVGVFAGTISTANNGGFAGCRSKAIEPAMDLSRFSGVELAVRGDGQRYKLIVRDDYSWNGIAWAYSFDTVKDTAITVRAPFSAFTPTLFAKTVRGAILKTDRISTVQLTLSKFEYDAELNAAFAAGPFRLELERIAAYE